MWIHLLTLGLIDGAGGSVTPPVVRPDFDVDVKKEKKRRLAKIRWKNHDYTMDESDIPAFLASIEKEVESKPKTRKPQKPKQAPNAVIIVSASDDVERMIQSTNNLIRTSWESAYNAYRSYIEALERSREEEEIEMLLLSM